MIDHNDASQSVQIVLEFAGSLNLGDYLEHMICSIFDIKQIFIGVCRAVEYLHGHGICHRDIKLQNIVMSDACLESSPGPTDVKLIDFGFACRFTLGDTLRQQVGTPAYMSPELVQKHPYDGFKVDVWALGVLLYRMVYKELPYRSRDAYDLYHKIKTADVCFPKTKDKEMIKLQKLMASLMQKDASRRPSIDKVR